MIVSRTPHRISFFGGGTDYPEYYKQYGGKTLGVAINKYSYLNVRKLPPFFDYKHRIVYSNQENVNSLDDIIHPSVRETLKFLNVNLGLSIHHDGDIPARSGMGSSSAFTVGLLNSINALNGKICSKYDLTKDSIHIEQNLIKENVGSQDQTFAAYGGLNIINFLQNGEINVNPIIMKNKKLKEFQDNIMLFFSGLSRTASEVVEEQIKKTNINVPNLNKMKDLVDDAYDILINKNRNLREFGELLNYTWELKKSLSSKVSNNNIDNMYEKAINAGAIGGKLLGAGGGGFMAFYVEKDKQLSVIDALKGYLHIPFDFDFEGSKIIVYEPNYKEK
ncbi:GHMP kinase [Arcobacter nitrofigilis DSM 7299]|uniref:GHMP kinase n=1 Tax=Arcobacter nitrofigilis (strain ATCC 33309 / DSM 7299 / CCUG 15893 / LMG 7604 / NCTC 12251 / CI) TaxID=572480 RepID=D5V7F3_ARCNC|nr:kinase [Arcobacter nitrofigilis]ADG94573.1 GHMP kinase [Arcobacter nitrofigilis DSM 7299]